MKRTIIKIDEGLCNGCGACVSGCHEGALQLINGKAVMISDLYCDGLGACIGECPVGAITLEERDAEPYDETSVMERLAPQGEAVILAHLRHLKDHNEEDWVREGVVYIREHGLEVDLSKIGYGRPERQPEKTGEDRVLDAEEKPLACGCPGSMSREIKRPFVVPHKAITSSTMRQVSELRQFPVQLHLLNPNAGFLQGANLLLAADCTAFASGDFHSRFLRGKVLAIACPKLDNNLQAYVDKLVQMIDVAKIDTLTVLVMEVPCCGGLVKIAQAAREQALRNIPVKVIVLSVEGEVKSEQWI